MCYRKTVGKFRSTFWLPGDPDVPLADDVECVPGRPLADDVVAGGESVLEI